MYILLIINLYKYFEQWISHVMIGLANSKNLVAQHQSKLSASSYQDKLYDFYRNFRGIRSNASDFDFDFIVLSET